MTFDENRITDEALALPPDSRATLAEKLLGSLTENLRDEIDEAWVEEAEARLESYNMGKVKAIPGQDVIESLQSEQNP